mmetsp:Transcript_23194/g.38148  ORF Transcript_23194/g.38148 Transcript_23194/m.38148 type:complete len:982 (-) Transcript_23194:515-3460(-)
MGILEITVVECKDLPDKAMIGKLDPYVRIQFGSIIVRTQTMQNAGTNVLFNEKLELSLSGNNADMALLLEAYDDDVIRDKFLGQCTPRVGDVINAGGQKLDKWYPLFRRSGKPAGQIRLIMQTLDVSKGAVAAGAAAGNSLSSSDKSNGRPSSGKNSTNPSPSPSSSPPSGPVPKLQLQLQQLEVATPDHRASPTPKIPRQQSDVSAVPRLSPRPAPPRTTSDVGGGHAKPGLGPNADLVAHPRLSSNVLPRQQSESRLSPRAPPAKALPRQQSDARLSPRNNNISNLPRQPSDARISPQIGHSPRKLSDKNLLPRQPSDVGARISPRNPTGANAVGRPPAAVTKKVTPLQPSPSFDQGKDHRPSTAPGIKTTNPSPPPGPIRPTKIAIVRSASKIKAAGEDKFVVQTESPVTSVDIHGTEPWVVISLASGAIELWDIESKKLVHSVAGYSNKKGQAVSCIRFVVREKWILADCDSTALRVYTVDSMIIQKEFEAHSSEISCLAVHPSASTVASCGHDKAIKIWDWSKDWSLLRQLTGHTAGVNSIVFSPMGGKTLASASTDKSVRVWDTSTGLCKLTVSDSGAINSVDYIAGEKKGALITGGTSKILLIWDCATRTSKKTLKGHEAPITAVLSNGDISNLITGSSDGVVKLWNSKNYQLESSADYELGGVRAIQSVAGKKRFGVACEQGAIVILDEVLWYLENQLAEIVGLKRLKDELRSFVKDMRLNQRRIAAGYKLELVCPHMLFFGNPGTGKTSVARMIPRLLSRIGVLSAEAESKFVEANRQNLVGQFIGATEKQTQDLIEKARGSVMFVDEAYRLTEGDSAKDFGKKAFETIMTEMTSARKDRVIFIFAGYKKPMDEFIKANEGMERRIGLRLHFEDYSPPELAQICRLKCQARGFKMDPSTDSTLSKLVDKSFPPEVRSRWNAGLSERLVEEATRALNQRLNPETASEADLMTLRLEDFAKGSDKLSATMSATK